MIIATDKLRSTFFTALKAHGMSVTQAATTAGVFLDAELAGKSSHGAFHLLTYLDALEEGAIKGDARPSASVRGSILRIDADKGLAQFALKESLDAVRDLARAQGVAIVAISNTYTTGELGWYPRLLARHGMISFTTTNSPALVALGDNGKRVLGTNPFAFGIPEGMIVDQAVSQSAFLAVRQRAERGEALPQDWGVDGDGKPTTDASKVVEEGALLPFGGQRGGNVALVFEMLAMLAGGVSSLEATAKAGSSPEVGLFLMVLDPGHFGEHTLTRLTDHLATLAAEHDVYVPGRTQLDAGFQQEVEIDDTTWQRLQSRL